MLDEPSLGLAPKVVKSILQTSLRSIDKNRPPFYWRNRIFIMPPGDSERYVLENGKVVMENASEVLLQSEHIKMNYLGL